MKGKILLLALLAPIMLQAQFTLEPTSDSIVIGKLDQDLTFDFKLTNVNQTELDLRWRIMSNDFPVEDWQDYFCGYVCWTPEIRAKDLLIGSSTPDLDVIHHIAMREQNGIGSSQICLFDKNDSANTLTCFTVKATSDPYLIYDSSLVSDHGDLIITLGKVFDVNTGLEYPTSDRFIAGDLHLMVIDGVIYEFAGDKWSLFTDKTDIIVDGLPYIIIDGKVYEQEGNTYVFVDDLTEIDLDGETYYVFGSDTFELINGNYLPLGLENSPSVEEVVIYPNPTQGLVTIKGVSSKASIEIFDALGKRIRTQSIESNRVDVSDLMPGIYVTKIVDGDEHYVKRITIKR